jgi:hypothetical protein
VRGGRKEEKRRKARGEERRGRKEEKGRKE